MAHLRPAIVLAVAATLVACTRSNSEFCETSGDCPSGFCDPVRNACVNGRCTPGQALGCSDDQASAIVCDDNGVPGEEACSLGCNADRGACNQCEAGIERCEDNGEVDELLVCSDDGELIEQRECLLGCKDDELACIDILPSNGLAADLDFIDRNPTAVTDLVLDEGFEIDSTTGAVTSAGATLDINSRIHLQDLDVMLRVFRVKSLRVNGSGTLVGDFPIAIVSDRDINIDGTMRVEAGRIGNGPCAGGAVEESAGRRSGGGGGGGGQSGGDGGDGGGVNGGNGGEPLPNDELIPLSAGCNGGRSIDVPEAGGGGGGGIQLVTRQVVRIAANGAIDAAGQGGAPFDEGASGGGSGGAVFIEAPVVRLAASAFVSANGGGGACFSEAGQDGPLSREAAQGGLCIAVGADGGSGGAAGRSPQNGNNDNQEPFHGGGGGGGAGRIRVNVFPGDAIDPLLFSPNVQFQVITTRE